MRETSIFQDLIVQPVKEALEYYRRLNEAAKDERHHRKSVVDVGESVPINASIGGIGSSSVVVKSTSSHSMRSKRSAGTIHSRSRSTDDDITENLMEEADNIESSDPETATEVEISEKTLKFKISTEGTLAGPTSGRKSYPGSRKGSREKSSLDYHNHDLAKAVRDHDRERRRSRGENLGSDLSSPVSARSAEGMRIHEEVQRNEAVFLNAKVEVRLPEGNGNVVAAEIRPQPKNNIRKNSCAIENDQESRPSRRDAHSSRESIGLRCCCDDKTGPNNHKSLFSRLRNITDRLSISFDSKESHSPKPKHTSKMLSKSNSVSSGSATTTASRHNNSLFICKRCNLAKDGSKAIATVVELSSVDKRAMTLPKVRKSTDCKNKSWKTVFAKEKRSSTSLETLPAAGTDGTSKHRRNLSNPEGKSQSMKEGKSRQVLDIEFREIDARPKKQQQPEIIVNPDDSVCDIEEDLGKVEIRRSSASMEDISKMAKQAEAAAVLGSLDPSKGEERPHTGSLDSMLCKEVCKSRKKHPAVYSSPATSKKSSPGLFSRFKSGMSIDSTRSNSNSDSLHDQGSQSGWISSLTASFRPKRHPNETPLSPHPPRSPSREEIKWYVLVVEDPSEKKLGLRGWWPENLFCCNS